MPYVPNKNSLVFLQRQTTRLPGMFYRVGKLNEKSIFKSLLAVLHSTYLSPEEAAVQNVDGALREWFFHGREVYEKRREQMITIMSRKGILHLSRFCEYSYDDFNSHLFADSVR
jgi:hypothetical protein